MTRPVRRRCSSPPKIKNCSLNPSLRGKGAMKEIRPQTFLRPDFFAVDYAFYSVIPEKALMMFKIQAMSATTAKTTKLAMVE